MSAKPAQVVGYLADELTAIGITGIRTNTAQFNQPAGDPAGRIVSETIRTLAVVSITDDLIVWCDEHAAWWHKPEQQETERHPLTTPDSLRRRVIDRLHTLHPVTNVTGSTAGSPNCAEARDAITRLRQALTEQTGTCEEHTPPGDPPHAVLRVGTSGGTAIDVLVTHHWYTFTDPDPDITDTTGTGWRRYAWTHPQAAAARLAQITRIAS